jgi:8-oxo-dGTP diphosphatase
VPTKLMGAAAIILDSEGHILLVKHSYGKCNWDLPGGKSEVNESAEETARREIREEIGIDVEIGQLTGVYYDCNYDMHHFVFMVSNRIDREPIPNSLEILECRFCSIHELPRPISDFTVKRIQDALNHDRQHLFHTIGPRQWI